MGTGLRIFLVNDDDCLERLSVARFERLVRRDSQERIPQCAGKRVRYAMVVLELENRKPLGIRGIEYAFLHFDSEGRIDAIEWEKEARLAMEVLPPLVNGRERSQVVDARYRFWRKRYDHEYKWIPNPEVEAAIVEAIFGK